MCTDVYWCVPMCTAVYQCVLMSTNVCWCVPMCTDLYWCVLMCTDVCQSVLMWTNVCRCVLMFTVSRSGHMGTRAPIQCALLLYLIRLTIIWSINIHISTHQYWSSVHPSTHHQSTSPPPASFSTSSTFETSKMCSATQHRSRTVGKNKKTRWPCHK